MLLHEVASEGVNQSIPKFYTTRNLISLPISPQVLITSCSLPLMEQYS